MDKSLTDKGEAEPPTPPARRFVRLKTVHDVNRLLAKTINQLLRDEMTESKASKVGYLCSIMVRAIETTELEQKLAELEAKFADLSK